MADQGDLGLGPALQVIPTGTRPDRCRSCQVAIYWIVTAKGKRMPVHVQAGKPGQVDPTATTPGAGIVHFADCPGAERWRGNRRRG